MGADTGRILPGVRRILVYHGWSLSLIGLYLILNSICVYNIFVYNIFVSKYMLVYNHSSSLQDIDFYRLSWFLWICV